MKYAELLGRVIIATGLMAWPWLAVAGSSSLSLTEARKILNQVRTVSDELHNELNSISEDYQLVDESKSGRLKRRLKEAEVQSLLEDHYRAAIILSDIAERPELRSDPDYPRALYLLAESLRKSGYPKLARVHYELLATREGGRSLSQVVLGLLEVASITGNFTNIDTYMARIKGKGALEDSKIEYVYGKALLRGAKKDQDRIKQALNKFRAVPHGLSISAPAAYYAGVALVQLKLYPEAIIEFQRALSLSSSATRGSEMQELSLLSLGRLYQELGDTPNALSAYQLISRNSVHFAEMLYEVAWVHVTAANASQANSPEQERQYRLALDVTELLMATAPNSLLFPEARVLQGNLRIRLGAKKQAYDIFQTVVDVYGGAKNEFEVLLASKKDAQAFFDELVVTDLNDLGRLSLLPDLFLQFALGDSNVSDTVDVRRALVATSEELKESIELVRTLEVALGSSQRFALFPGLADGLTKAISLLHRTLFYRQKLLEAERGLVAKYISPAAKAELEVAYFREKTFESQLQSLPLSAEAIELYRKGLRKQYASVQQRVFLQRSSVESMQAQLAAARIWIARHRPVMDDEEHEITKKRLRAADIELRLLINSIGKLGSAAKRSAMYAGEYSGWARGVRLGKYLGAWEDKQANIIEVNRARISDTHLGVVMRIAEQRKVLRSLEKELLVLHDKLDQTVEVRVGEIRAKILKEFRLLERLEIEHQRLSQVSDDMLSPIAARTIDKVGQRFRQLVLRADVGILDVAWARKRATTDEVTELVQELRLRSGELDSEFRGVLEDN
ncbi:MAG: hypothetical protein KTR25_01810 [Myxococcales bacterium]|nr:hypothetical protein [Myxococcales bacterium]